MNLSAGLKSFHFELPCLEKKGLKIVMWDFNPAEPHMISCADPLCASVSQPQPWVLALCWLYVVYFPLIVQIMLALRCVNFPCLSFPFLMCKLAMRVTCRHESFDGGPFLVLGMVLSSCRLAGVSCLCSLYTFRHLCEHCGE